MPYIELQNHRYELPTSPTPWDFNRIYLCPKCGDVWARWYMASVDYYALHSPCPIHSWIGNSRPGSLLYDWKADLQRLPPLLLRRELFLHLTKEEQCQVPLLFKNHP